MTSIDEGIGNVVIEAMSVGLPVITTDCGGMEEVIVSGYNGLAVPTYNDKALAEALVFLLQHPHEAKRMAKNGHRTYRRRFTMEKSGRAWMDFYEGLVTSHDA